MGQESPRVGSTGSALLDVFTLEQLTTDVWRSRISDPRGGRMFGGTTIAQLLWAAKSSTEGAWCSSAVNVHFLQPADGSRPCDYRVHRIHDGRSSAVRSITVTQGGDVVAIGTVSLRAPRATWAHGSATPAPVHPDALPRTGMPHRARAIPPEAFDIRYHDDWEDGQFVRRLWFRAVEKLPDEPTVHECVMSFIGDLYFFEPIVAQHGFGGNDPSIRYATTQQTTWFHRAPRLDDWLLIESRSPVGEGGRGLVSGQIRTTHGVVVATLVQEVAIRMTTDDGQRAV